MEYINLSIKTLPGIPPIRVRPGVVWVDVPALLDLDMLDENLLNSEAVFSRLLNRTIAQGKRET